MDVGAWGSFLHKEPAGKVRAGTATGVGEQAVTRDFIRFVKGNAVHE